MFSPSLSGHGQPSAAASPVRPGRGARSCSTLPCSEEVVPCAVHVPDCVGECVAPFHRRPHRHFPPFSRRKPQDVAPLRVEHKLAHSPPPCGQGLTVAAAVPPPPFRAALRAAECRRRAPTSTDAVPAAQHMQSAPQQR
ncbi:uncharacterized protein Tco025E_09436 [Trypanosoma conorhini]|uniref:Uncharacterized protein n=1 Tax=Trypanosoma conorhini TaxID=83891 RepID=A0A3R7N6S5_9TRYP|nr:uncharacterized protein Tco025E_09436 [Trypanosoma conorhini]RNE97507.1 hypothetical protein Tco025E_09436 [Trypanosoma conorhini]